MKQSGDPYYVIRVPLALGLLGIEYHTWAYHVTCDSYLGSILFKLKKVMLAFTDIF